MKIVNGKKFLEDYDMVRVSKVIVGHHYGLNAVLTGVSVATYEMTFGEFKKRLESNELPVDDGVCVFRYDIGPCED